ncbi:MAG: hypothetical protein H7X94_11395, partial [Vallitaleaceae bacterium]|nr:hypothetical protein [Vallitaleaceae bacterium]
EQLNTLENPSEEYSAAVYSFMLENANIVDKLSSFDYNTLLASEQLDLSNLQDVKTNVSTLLEGLAQMPISTEVDKTYNDLMISMYTSMVVMMDIFIENIESLKFIAAYQSDEESFIQLGLKETDVTIQEWKDAMKK